MTILTKEALYTLLLMNDQSNDLTFLPLDPEQKYENRKEALQAALVQGKQDLEKVGLLSEHEPSDEFVRLGYYLKEYAENTYHFQVDSNYFCAPGVDRHGRMAVLIKQIGENQYVIDYFTTAVVLSIFMENHEILHHLDDKQKNYLRSDWQPYAYMRLLTYYGSSKTIRIRSEQVGNILEDILFFNSKSGLYEYDLKKEKIRSVSVPDMKKIILKNMRVKV